MYEKRIYRDKMKGEGLEYFRVVEFESDLEIAISTEGYHEGMTEQEVLAKIQAVRKVLTDYQQHNPEFFPALQPIPVKSEDPLLIRKMKMASHAADVGPMAAVAGAVSDAVGRDLMKKNQEVIVENGGDLFLKTTHTRQVAIDTGKSGFNGLKIEIAPQSIPLGICTSSGTMGHSLSFGKADAATIISHDVLLSDAVATAVGNRVKTGENITEAIEWARQIHGVRGILIIADGKLGAWGEIKLV